MKKVLCNIALIGFLLPSVSVAQDNAAQQKLIKVGYLLSVESVRLNTIRNEISEISKKNIALNEFNNPELYHITMLLENIFLIETICLYESLLLNALESMEERKKLERYKLHYSRLKKDTLKRLYLNFKSTQSNFAKIADKEVLILSDRVKKEMLKVLSLIEEVINILQSQLPPA